MEDPGCFLRAPLRRLGLSRPRAASFFLEGPEQAAVFLLQNPPWEAVRDEVSSGAGEEGLGRLCPADVSLGLAAALAPKGILANELDRHFPTQTWGVFVPKTSRTAPASLGAALPCASPGNLRTLSDGWCRCPLFGWDFSLGV